MITIIQDMQALKEHLTAQLKATYIQVRNDSHLHQSHYEADETDSLPSHLHITLVSPLFENQSLVKRHRLINNILKDAFDQGLHALGLSCYSPDEFGIVAK